MTQIELALKIAIEAHAGQFRRPDPGDRYLHYVSEVPYVTHPIVVAMSLPDELRPAAILHDVLEDTTVTREDLLRWGVDFFTVELVQLLTKAGSESYEHYIRRVTANYNAARIKLADMRHNLSANPSKKSIEKSKWALPLLEAAVRRSNTGDY